MFGQTYFGETYFGGTTLFAASVPPTSLGFISQPGLVHPTQMTELTIEPSDFDQAQERLREQMKASPYLTVPEVCALARCEQKAVRKAVHEGALPAFAPNRKPSSGRRTLERGWSPGRLPAAPVRARGDLGARSRSGAARGRWRRSVRFSAT